LGYWLLTSYGALAFATALLTSLTTASVVRIFAEVGVVVGAFGALIAHRWWPRTSTRRRSSTPSEARVEWRQRERCSHASLR